MQQIKTLVLLLVLGVTQLCAHTCDYCAGGEGRPTHLSLQETLHRALCCQWEIHLANVDVRRQYGMVTRSQGYLDPMLKLQASQAWWRNNTRQEGLDLPDGLTVDLPLIGSQTAHGLAGIKFDGETQRVRAELSKKIRLGTEFSIGTQTIRQENPIFILQDPYPSFATSQINYFQQTQTELFFVIKQPLMKGFRYGREVTNECKQRLDLCASQYQMLWDISKQLFEATSAYWELARTQEVLAARQDEERQTESYFEDVQALVQERQRGRGELSQVVSQLAQAKAQVLVAQQEVVAAKRKLLLAMGLSEEDCGENWNLLDQLPSIDDSWLCQDNLMDWASCLALKRRPDLRSMFYQKQATQTSIRGARNEMQPEVNVSVEERLQNTNYQKRASDPFQGYYTHVPRQEFRVALEVNWPIGHTEARGNLQVACSAREQISWKIQQHSAEITTNVIKTLCDQVNLSGSVRDFARGVSEASEYVLAQQELFHAGETSLFQLLDSRQKHTEARIKHITAAADYAINLAKLRLVLGMVLRCHPCSDEIIVEDLTEVPSFLAREDR